MLGDNVAPHAFAAERPLGSGGAVGGAHVQNTRGRPGVLRADG